MYYLYKITNGINGKVYIGQTRKSVEQRWKQHSKNLSRPERYLSRAIKKYGKDSFSIQTLVIVENKKQADYYERQLISIKQSNKEAFGYNCTSGGDYCFLSESSKKRMSDAKKKWWADHPETIGPALGHKHSKETLAKFSLQRRGKNNPAYRHDVNTNEILFLKNKGLLWVEIAKILNIHRDTIRNRIKALLPKHEIVT